MKTNSDILIGYYRLSLPGIGLCIRHGYSRMSIRGSGMRQPEGFAKGLHTGNMGGSSTRIVLGMGPHGIEWFGKILSPFVNFL